MLFVGEALGIYYPLEKDIYLRIASPPGFDIRDHLKSLGVLKNLDIALLCFGHYGISCATEKIFRYLRNLPINDFRKLAASPDPPYSLALFPP